MNSNEKQQSGLFITVCKYSIILPLFLLTLLSRTNTEEAVPDSAPSTYHAGYIYATSHTTARDRGRLSSTRADSASCERYERRVICCNLSQPLSDMGPGCPVHSIFSDSMGGIGAYSTGVISIPPYAEEQVEWYPRGGTADEVRIVVDRKVCLFGSCLIKPY